MDDKDIYLPEYTWELIKSYLIIKIHPLAKLIKTYSIRYTNPSIFMTRYVKQKDGSYKFSRNNKLDISYSPEKLFGDFYFYLKSKKILMRYCKSCKKMSPVFDVVRIPRIHKDYLECCSKTISVSSYLEY